MSPTLFALTVSVAILVSMLGLGAAGVLLLRMRAVALLRQRVHRDAPVGVEFAEAGSHSMMTSIARSGRRIEGWVDADGESARLLLQAGWRSARVRLLWYVFQGVLPLVLGAAVVAFILTADVPNKSMLSVAFCFAAAALSFLMPRWILRSAAARRRARLKAETPLFIHLLVLLFEAGLSTRQALVSLVREGGGVLPHLGGEFELVVRQLEAGADISETLKSMSDVMQVDDLSSVVAVLRQVDRYGGEVREPLLEALQVMEERRSLDLREKVNVLSGRMTVVMVLFFFPALLIFVAGPAFLSIIRALGDING